MNTSKKTWNGHTGTILAVDINTDGLLTSVAEDGRCILWSLDGEIVSDTCVINTVTAGVGHSSTSEDSPLNSVKFVRNDPNKFFISSGKQVLGYDVRKPSSCFIKFEYNSDEINELCVNSKGEYLAACDDGGEIKVIDLQQARLFKTLSRRHTNICSSVEFRQQRPWQILSAGLDCNIVHWDFSTGKSRQIFNVNNHLENNEGKPGLAINPPFVHSLSVSKDGWRFAAGLGNGNVGLFKFKAKTFQCSKTFKAHASEVSQVCYFDAKSSNSLLLSGGNDGMINIWREMQDGEEAEDGLLCKISHGSKINWMTCCSLTRDFIFVADQSSNVNVYEIRH